MTAPGLLLRTGMAVLSLASAYAGQAAQIHQDHGTTPMEHGGKHGSMQDGMEMQMMNDPVHRAAMTVFVLPLLQTDLGLSTQQVVDLGQMKRDFIAAAKDLAPESKNKELDVTLAKMKAALTEEQRVKLVEMKPVEVHRVVMARVPMAEHTIMAGFVSSGSMGRGMTKKGGGK